MEIEDYLHLSNRRSPTDQNLLARSFDTSRGLWLAVDAEDYPHILVESQEKTKETDLRLKIIDAEFARQCEILDVDQDLQQGAFTVIRLNDRNLDQVRLFLKLMETVLAAEPSELTAKTIRSRLVALAQLLEQADDGRNDLVGLWGELFVIQSATDTELAVQHWCSSPTAKYDFVTSSAFLEVKTTLKPRRSHRFSLEQLRPVEDQDLFVASVLLVEKPSGKPAGALVDEISKRLKTPEHKQAFLAQCILKGGRNLYRTDLKLSALPKGASLAIIDGTTIPAPTVQSDDPISNIRFEVDLTGLAQLPKQEVRTLLRFDNK